MLRAFAEAALAFDSQPYRDAAATTPTSFFARCGLQARLLRTWKDGLARLNGYLEDYACLIDGLIATHAATFDARYLSAAVELADEMIDLFWDDEVQGFFDTGRDHEALITRPRDFFDNATPSGTSVAVDVLLKLAAPHQQRRLRAPRHDLSAYPRPLHRERPDRFRPPPRRPRLPPLDAPGARHRFAAGERRECASRHGPRASTLPTSSSSAAPSARPTTQRRCSTTVKPSTAEPTAYLCERYVCQAPTTDPAELAAQLVATLA